MSDRRSKRRPKKSNGTNGTNGKRPSGEEPVQLTIAAYGRKKTAKKRSHLVVSTSPSDSDESGTTVMVVDDDSGSDNADDTPIVLSLPVTDAMEDKFTNQHTLDTELTSYRPDLLDQPSPLALVSGTEGHPLKKTAQPDQRLTVKRCPMCMDSAGPCDECQSLFNQKFCRSLSDYQISRDQQDELFGAPDPTAFRNDTISDAPLPNFKPPVYHHRKGVENVSDCELDPQAQPQGYSESGWELGDAETQQHTGALTPAQRQNFQQQEMDRLRRKVAYLEDIIDNGGMPDNPEGHQQPQQPATPDSFVRECMWHMEPFFTEPVGLPMHYDQVTGSFDSIGCFCSLQCAYAYRLEHRSAEAAPLHLLFKAHRMLMAMDCEDGEQPVKVQLLPAPPRQALRRWGGRLDLSDFLSVSQVWRTLSRHPFVPTAEFVDAAEKTTITYRAPSATTTGEGLVRRRTKPHPNAANQWSNAIRRSKLRR